MNRSIPGVVVLKKLTVAERERVPCLQHHGSPWKSQELTDSDLDAEAFRGAFSRLNYSAIH